MEETEKEIAPDIDKFSWYLAGLLDSKGSFLVQINRNKTNFSPCLRIKITLMNKEALLKLKELFRIGTVYPYNSQMAKNSKKSYQWYCSSLRDVKRVVELVDGKMLIKANELEKIKQIIDIIEQKRKERGTGKSAFTKEELSKILEIRDSMRNPIQRDKKYKAKDIFLNTVP